MSGPERWHEDTDPFEEEDGSGASEEGGSGASEDDETDVPITGEDRAGLAGVDLTGAADELEEVIEDVVLEPHDDDSDDTDAPTDPAESRDPAESTTSEPATDEWAVRRIVWTMVPLLAGLSVLQLVSGSVLEAFEETLLVNPALLVLVPVQIGTAGNLASIMCSRLTTQLYLGTYEPSLSNPGVRANVGAVFGLAGTVFGIVGVAAWAIGTVLGGSLGLTQVLFISLVSGLLLAILVVITSVVAVEASYRVGLNPDDTTIPIVTNVCDITGVLILFAVVSVVV